VKRQTAFAVAAADISATVNRPLPTIIRAIAIGPRDYDAQCTPDFFGFNAQDELEYRGRLDASRMTPVPNARRDLFEAMKQIAETDHGPKEQIPSMGCSIKWKH
jgi:hypothetical protein